MSEKFDNSISTKELCREYVWYQNTFSSIIQNACDEFFGQNFKFNLIGISQNISYLTDNEGCFVTKARINNDYEIFFRLTGQAVKVILDRILGESKYKFNLNKISELESKIINRFNAELFKVFKQNINSPNPKELKRENYDTIHLTFLLQEVDEYSKKSGKVIVTLPKVLLNPELINSSHETYTDDDFPDSETIVKILVGSTKFSLYNLKNLENDDIVVFDNSNIEELKLETKSTTLNVNINPNMELLISEEINEGDDNMADSQNIWDNIEVEINAEFDAVKIALGELKDIENGLVVDLASLYDNNVTLKVEGKAIASGTLVIVNDRYGVKINNVIAQEGRNNNIEEEQSNEEVYDEENLEEEYSGENEEYDDSDNEEYNETEEQNEEGDEEFDYSDFELEDDNL